MDDLNGAFLAVASAVMFGIGLVAYMMAAGKKQGTLAGFVKKPGDAGYAEAAARNAAAATDRARESAASRATKKLRDGVSKALSSYLGLADLPVSAGNPPTPVKEARFVLRAFDEYILTIDLALLLKPASAVEFPQHELFKDTWESFVAYARDPETGATLPRAVGLTKSHGKDDNHTFLFVLERVIAARRASELAKEEGIAGGGGSAADAQVDSAEGSHFVRTPEARRFLQPFLYIWRGGVGSDHVGLHSALTAMTLIKEKLYHEVPKSTMYTWLAQEAALLKNGGGLKKCPDMIELISSFKRARDDDSDMAKQPEHTRLPKVFWPELADRILLALKAPVFTTEIGIETTAVFFSEKFPEDEWVPSTSWMHRFFKNFMNLTPRRITGNAMKGGVVEIAAQKAMLDATYQYIAGQLESRKVLLEDIYASDELGVHLVPRASTQWEAKGSRTVLAVTPENKAQITADFGINAAGSIVRMHQITSGRSERSLPAQAIIDKCPRTVFNYTDNHW